MTEEQKTLYKLAISSDGPFITNDPVVNHAVDSYMDDSTTPYDEEEYRNEIKAWKDAGKRLLAFV